MKGLPSRSVHPAAQLLMLLGLAVVGLCLASLLALALATALYGVSMEQFGSLAAMPDQYPHGWEALML
jgi:hypothetical protein